MKLTDIKNSLNEISAIGGLKQVVKGNTDRVEGIKLSKEMAQAMIDWFNSSPYGRKYPNAKKGRLNLSLGIMSNMGLDRYAKHKGAKDELKYIKTLSKAMRDNVNESSLKLDEGTRSQVGVIDKGGKIQSAYVHFDGYPSNMKPGIKKHIKNEKDVIKLIKKGGARGIFDDKPIEYYNEKPSPLKGNVKDIEKYIKSADSNGGAEFVYLYDMRDKKWYFADVYAKSGLKALYESLNERDDAGTHLDKLASLVGKSKDFFTIGKELDKGGYKKKYFYSDSMVPMYQIEIDGFKFGILNKKYVDKGDREVGSTAIGLMESMKVNEAKYDIGMARKGNGITVYNRAEEEAGDYKNVAHIDNKGKIKYYDKKVPSKVKKEIESKAKEMMEVKIEGTMKLKDLLNESFESMKVYSNPFHTPFVKENEEERGEESNEMTNEQKSAFLEAVKSYKQFGETVYRKEGLAKVYESIKNVVELAGKNMVKETEGSFDGITVGRHVKRMNESFKIFEKTLREVHTLQQRLESTYDEIGEVFGKYYEINETEDKVKEGNEFGAARAKAIAAGEDSFEVDGKKYPVKSVDKDDKENAKDFANESKSMRLTSLLNESFGIGDLPSSKLKKMKMSFKEVLELDKDKMAKLHKDGEIEIGGEKIVFNNETYEDEISVDDETEFKVDLKHLLDKHKVEEDKVDEKAPKMKSSPYVQKVRNAGLELAKVGNGMKFDDPNGFAKAKSSYNKAIKAIQNFQLDVTRFGKNY